MSTTDLVALSTTSSAPLELQYSTTSFTPLYLHSQMTGGEAIHAVGFVNSVLRKVFDVIARDRTMQSAIKRGLEVLKREMSMVASEIERNEKKQQGATHESKIVLLRELVCEIEDFIDLTWVPGRGSGFVLSAFGLDPRTGILQRIDHFKDSIQTVRNWQPGDAGGSHGGDDGAVTWSCSSATPTQSYSQEVALGSICKHRDELGTLLTEAGGQELKVISIVGCRGMGKTTLARAVYDHCRASGQFDCVAWVVATECRGPEDLLTKVLKEAHSTAEPTRAAEGSGISDIEQTSLGFFLRDKRSLSLSLSLNDISLIYLFFLRETRTLNLKIIISIREI